ncbi:MAG TPA: aminodeoxychorismate synthase component I [Myxococcota bacterium]|nr:aminodeoxychorismate synthase component I [Myxococcota bacterium]
MREVARGARDLLGAFELLRGDALPWLLESALPDARLGRFSFCGSDPWLVVRAKGRRLRFERRREVGAPLRALARGAPLEALRPLLSPRPPDVAGAPPFAAGLVGFLGHELAARLEPSVSFHAEDDLGLPDLAFLAVDRVLALEHATGRVVATGYGVGPSESAARERAEGAADALAGRVAPAWRATPERVVPPPGRATRPSTCVSARFDESRYAKVVAAAKERIAAGDVYQVCLTHRLEAPFRGDPWRLYLALRRETPAPFASYLELPEAALVGASPERFLRVGPDGEIETRPMKGTRPRGATPEDDARLRRELLESPKDRAENVMIVDLARHDLGRVCVTGSVSVPELCAIESYATVHQLVSTVRGTLPPEADALDAVAAAFPPGSMTGAPKLAALRILDALEPVRRGPYGGAVGYLDVRGRADLAVAIRGAIVREGRVYAGVGGGIVADSEPAAEWRESLDKARALVAALAEAEREAPIASPDA